MWKPVLLPALLLAVSPLSASAGQTAFQREQQQMMRQEQQMMAQQQKMMQQQEKAMMQQQKTWYEQQQKAMQQQHQQMLKAQQQQQQQAKAQQAKAAVTPVSSSGAQNQGKTTQNAKTSTTTAATTTHKPATAAATAHGHRMMTWPHASTASYRNLMHLKHSLDTVTASRSGVSASHKSALRGALLNVVENAPRPASNHVLQLSNDLAAGLSGRSSGGGAVNTKDLALSLRAIMNSVHLTPDQAEQALATSQNVLSSAGVSSAHLGAITGDLQFLSNEVVMRAASR